MKKLLLAALFALLPAAVAQAQIVCPSSDLTCPAFTYGFIPSPAQWNNWFASKQAALGYVPLNAANNLSDVPNKATARSNLQIPNTGSITFTLAAVNFNAANTDNAITISLPTGYTRFTVQSVILFHPSTAMSTATFGVFTATAGGGAQLVPTTTVAISSASENTAGNAQTTSGTTSVTSNSATVQFRTLTAQGSAATADVSLVIRPLP
jgi:hypothetical protein